MIIFKKVRYKNFLSTGQQFIEINLNEAPTTLVVGNNGAGKSTMLDALCFGLFAKPFRAVKKDQLVNTINEKECVVEVEFQIGKKEYKIWSRVTLYLRHAKSYLLLEQILERDYQYDRDCLRVVRFLSCYLAQAYL